MSDQDRPARVTRAQTVTHARRPAKELLSMISAKHMAQIADNDKLEVCCRDVFKHEVEFAKTDPDLPNPDHLVFHCQCGRKHKVFGLGGAAGTVAQ